jgi:aryl-alcohol dehydrogenase-like predicted oxidoreductase
MRRTRPLAADGVEITTLGLGAWAMGGGGPLGLGATDDDESVAAICAAVEAGINWIDTAPAYGAGHSETVVRRALERYRPGEDVFTFTKCGVAFDRGFEIDGRAESVRAGIEASLRRLGVERLDAVQIHWPDTSTATRLEESWQTLAELVDEGKVRWIGASNVDVAMLERIEPLRHVDLIQPVVSLLRRGARDSLLPWGQAHGTAVIAYSPLGTGLLTGSWSRDRVASIGDDDARARLWPDFSEPRLTAVLELVDRLRPIAHRLGTTLSALAVAWVLHLPGITGAIVGGRRVDQLPGWLPADELELDAATLAEVDAAVGDTGAGDDDPPVTGF